MCEMTSLCLTAQGLGVYINISIPMKVLYGHNIKCIVLRCVRTQRNPNSQNINLFFFILLLEKSSIYVTKHYIFGLVTIQGLLLHFVCLAAKKVIARWFFFTFFICLQLCCLPLLFERLSKSHNRDIKRCIFKLGIINYKIKYAFSTLSDSYRTDVPTTWIRDPLTEGNPNSFCLLTFIAASASSLQFLCHFTYHHSNDKGHNRIEILLDRV
jgi:hypothetical protein